MAPVTISRSATLVPIRAGGRLGVSTIPDMPIPVANYTTASNYSTSQSCPLNVCCSEFGFCGTSSDFCGDAEWPSPSCSGSSSVTRRIGYYEAWNLDHSCNTMTPEEIPIGAYTHLFFSFLYIDPDTYQLTPMASNQTDTLSQFAALKEYGVELWISVGGWDMNDPGPYANVLSDLAASDTAQQAFIDSVKDVLEEYDLDGIDIDWEYPVASDRSGTPDDYDNFVSFLENVRSSMGDSYGLSITLPSSYWYLQHFDIVNLAKTVDWFNFMSYDIHGTWDAGIESIGSYVYASTNLSMIDKGLQLLWHNDIPASQVNLGLGFYGRSYTLEDPSCIQPGCPFSGGGNPGLCSQTSGILSYDEIQYIVNDPSRNPTVWLDSDSAVKIAVFDEDQWVAYDDPETLQIKLEFANSKCMEGVFVWAVDEDVSGNLAESISNATDLFPAGGSGELYVSPDIWDSDSPDLSCQAPCTFILPLLPLPTPTTVTWPPLTTSLLVSVDGGVSTTTTTISVPDFEVTAIPFWPVTVASNDTAGAMTPVQSIAPPSLVLTLPGSVTPIPPATVNHTLVAESQLAGITVAPTATGTTTSATGSTSTTSAVATPSQIAANMAPGCTEFYQVQDGDSCWSIEDRFDISAADFESWNPDIGDDCASGVWLNYYYCISHGDPAGTSTGGSQPSSTDSTGTPVFYSTSHPVTIQPQATHATVTPEDPVPPIKIDIGPPKGASSKGGCDGCGELDCGLFGCDGGCGLFGCDGGCGLWWCGGGCGLEYCGPGCGTGDCIITGGGGGGGSTGSLGPNEGENQDCDSMETADICTVYIKSFSSSGMASSSTTTSTNCAPTQGCSVTASTTTTTISTTGTYSTITNTFMLGPEPTVADSVLSSISASIVSQRSVWDATRWAGYTITVTSTSSGTEHSSSTSTTTSSSSHSTSTSTSTSTSITHGTPTATSVDATPTTFHSPSDESHILMNFYKDSSCGDFIAGYEWDNDPHDSFGYCESWGLDEIDGGDMVASSVYAVFSESDWNLGIESLWADCNSNNLGQQLKSRTCYKLDYNPDGDDSSARGVWIVFSNDVPYAPGS
ncbi:hypothetical protein BJX61DRAFT_515871 [Aspergillus egyptiacus]|nr:hypothetical protein BJX61DRAFT_515871 [Aspergillus egyptiacus]